MSREKGGGRRSGGCIKRDPVIDLIRGIEGGTENAGFFCLWGMVFGISEGSRFTDE